MEGLGENWGLDPCFQSRDMDQKPNTDTSSMLHYMDADPLQPFHQIGSGAETSGNYGSSCGSRCECGHEKLPPINTFLTQPQHPYTSVELRGVKRSRDWTQSETVFSGSQQGVGGAAEDILQVNERQSFQQPLTHGEQQSQGPIPYTQNPATLGSRDDLVNRSNHRRMRRDQFLLKFWQDKRGHIKRPMNAFLLWSKIHRRAIKEQNPEASLTDISSLLGHEWSKLREEERIPYFRKAEKLKQIHKQKFPEYEYRPLRKKSKQLILPRQGGGQGTPFSAPSLVPPQSEFQGPAMNVWPAMPCTVGYCSCPSFYQYESVDPYSSGNIQPTGFQNYCNTMKSEANYHSGHPQMVESSLVSSYFETKQQEHSVFYDHQEYMTGSTSTPDSLEPSDIFTSQQLSPNNTADSIYDDYVDVVGLL